MVSKETNKTKIFDHAFTGIFVIAIIVNIGVSVIIPVIPNIMRHYGLDVNFITTAFVFLFLGRVLSSIWVGKILHKYDVVPILFLVFSLHFVTMILLAYTKTAQFFIILRFFEGVFEGVLSVLLQYLVISLSTTKDRGVKMGYLGSAFGLGFIIGPVLGSIAMQLFGPSGVFILTALLMLFSGIWLLYVKGDIQSKLKHSKYEEEKSSSLLLQVEYFRFLPYYGGAILQRVLVVAFAILLPFYLVDKFHMDDYMVGYFFTGSAMITTFLMPYTGKLFGNTKHQGFVVFLAISTMGLSILEMGLTDDLIVFAVFFLIETIAFSIMSPNAMNIFGNQIESHPQKGQIIGNFSSLREIFSILIALTLLPIYSYNELIAWVSLSIISFMIAIPYLRSTTRIL